MRRRRKENNDRRKRKRSPTPSKIIVEGKEQEKLSRDRQVDHPIYAGSK